MLRATHVPVDACTSPCSPPERGVQRGPLPIALQPVVIQQESEIDDGLKREWSAPDLGIDKHYGYAFQWFAMAAAIVIIYLVCNVRKRT